MALTYINPVTPTDFEVDPISRIEGHLGVKVTLGTDGKITDAKAHGNLFRGFENFLLGREVNDAITFTQRICGVCPVPHGLTSTYAADTVLGYSEGHITFADNDTYGIPKKAVHIRNIVLASEFLMSSITHFYHLAAPSYVMGPAMPPWTPYFDQEYYSTFLRNVVDDSAGASTDAQKPNRSVPEMVLHADDASTHNGFSKDLWSTVIRSYVKALRVRRLTFEAAALFAGRMPMTSCFIGGGVTYDRTEALGLRCAKFEEIMSEVGKFVIQEYIPITLALGALYPTFDNSATSYADESFSGDGTTVLFTLAHAPIDTSTAIAKDSVTITVDSVAVLAADYTVDCASGEVTFATAPAAGTDNVLISYTVIGRGFGAGLGNFLAWGGFPSATDTTDSAPLLLPGGVYVGGLTGANTFTAGTRAAIAANFLAGANSVPNNLVEDIAFSKYDVSTDHDSTAYGTNTYAYPGDVSRTKPNRGKSGAYTYMKAPRWDDTSMEVGPLARLVVAGYYPVDGRYLRDVVAPPAMAGYGDYVRTVHADSDVVGLNPAMIDPDIAVALVREGAAQLWVWGGAAWTKVNNSGGAGFVAIDTLNYSQIDAAYKNANAVIVDGAVVSLVSFIYNLRGGLSTMDRLRARAIESLVIVQAMLGAYVPGAHYAVGAFAGDGWLSSLAGMPVATGNTYNKDTWTWKPKDIPTGTKQGWGGTEAPRGALMHQCTIDNGKISKYQCIVPTTWNGSPKSTLAAAKPGGEHGAIEAAMIGMTYASNGGRFTTQGGAVGTVTGGGVEVLRVAQSFDPCIACAVH